MSAQHQESDENGFAALFGAGRGSDRPTGEWFDALDNAPLRRWLQHAHTSGYSSLIIDRTDDGAQLRAAHGRPDKRTLDVTMEQAQAIIDIWPDDLSLVWREVIVKGKLDAPNRIRYGNLAPPDVSWWKRRKQTRG